MRRNQQRAIAASRRWLDVIASGAPSARVRAEIASETLENFASHVNRGFLHYRKAVTEAGDHAAIEWDGQGSIVRDLTGREVIDCLGGFGVYSAGIKHPKIVGAVARQLARMPLSSQELLDPLRGALAALLAEIAPGDLQCSFLINNGTDAVEGAMKLARLYTGRPGFVACLGGFHGKSCGALSVMGRAAYRRPFEPLLEDVAFVPFGDAEAVDAALEKAEEVGRGIAAVIAEPIQGEAGAIVPPDGFWPRLRETCDRHQVLLIADEVQTGLGRTGTLFGVDHWQVTPDILCLGKALGGGVMPLSAFISTPRIWSVLEENPFLHSSTFGGNPLACAAGIAAISVTLEEDLPSQAAAKGRYLLERLQVIRARHPDHLVEARGRGLLIGLEFVDQTAGYAVAAGLFRRGVLVAGTLLNARTLRLEPALNIPMRLLDVVLEALEDTLGEVARRPALVA